VDAAAGVRRLASGLSVAVAARSAFFALPVHIAMLTPHLSSTAYIHASAHAAMLALALVPAAHRLPPCTSQHSVAMAFICCSIGGVMRIIFAGLRNAA